MHKINRTIASFAAILAKFCCTGFVAKGKTCKNNKKATRAATTRAATTKAATTVQAMRKTNRTRLKSSTAQTKTNNVAS